MTEGFPPFSEEGAEEFLDVDSFVAPTHKADTFFQKLKEGKSLGSPRAVDPNQIYGWRGPEGVGEDVGGFSGGPVGGQGLSDDLWGSPASAAPEAFSALPAPDQEGTPLVLSPSDVTVATGDAPGEVVLMVGPLAKVVLTEEDVQRLIDSLTGSLEVTPRDESFPDTPEVGEVEAVMKNQNERWIRERALRAVAKVYDLNDPKNFPAAKALFEKLVSEYGGWDGVVRKGAEQRSSRKASFHSGVKVSPTVGPVKHATARQRRAALAAAVAKKSRQFKGG